MNLGPLLYSFFEDYLKVQKGLRPASLKSYRDAIRLFLHFVAKDRGCKISRLSLSDVTHDRALRFLRYVEENRGNHIRSRNHRLTVLRVFFDYAAARMPEVLSEASRVAAIPTKRAAPPETHFLSREDIHTLFSGLSPGRRFLLRDRALLLFLYNTGARVQEVADLCVANLQLDAQPRVRLHGKGGKWRICPIWAETASLLTQLLKASDLCPDSPVFASRGHALTRFGIYKIVRRHTTQLTLSASRHVSPHVFRHTTAVHLLEAGVEVNVIRGWLGHVSLDTTNRYAEITIRAKEEALRTCEPPISSDTFPRKPVWRDDENLLKWLDSL
ncbi:MAG: tyrosine-type recombinase/integrase [Syntrophorhabdales bacterium]|jgi:site-specific recombinase XerD